MILFPSKKKGITDGKSENKCVPKTYLSKSTTILIALLWKKSKIGWGYSDVQKLAQAAQISSVHDSHRVDD